MYLPLKYNNNIKSIHLLSVQSSILYTSISKGKYACLLHFNHICKSHIRPLSYIIKLHLAVYTYILINTYGWNTILIMTFHLAHRLEPSLSKYHCSDMSYSYFLLRCNLCHRSMSLCFQYQQDEIHYSL